MTVTEASKELNLSPQLLRCWIQSGTCEFGFIVRPKAKQTGRNSYYVCEERMKAWMRGNNGQFNNSNNGDHFSADDSTGSMSSVVG